MSVGSNNFSFFIGFLLSFFAHALAAFIALFALERQAATLTAPPEIFTVTIEGGEKLGGISQVPEEGAKAPDVLPFKPELGSTPEAEEVEESSEKKLEAPSVVKDPEIERQKQLEEKKRKEEAEKKKKAEEAKKKAEEKKRKEKERQRKEAQRKAAEKKRKAAEAKRKKEGERKRIAREKKLRDKRIQDAVKRASNYSGESSNAGGQGLGAARIGGKGMGGGTLASAEFIAYQNALIDHIKRGWRWGLPASRVLTTRVRVKILRGGVITDVQVIADSGNPRFDDSVLRAVYKSSPVPPAPDHLYSRFKEINITFDSE